LENEKNVEKIKIVKVAFSSKIKIISNVPNNIGYLPPTYCKNS